MCSDFAISMDCFGFQIKPDSGLNMLNHYFKFEMGWPIDAD